MNRKMSLSRLMLAILCLGAGADAISAPMLPRDMNNKALENVKKNPTSLSLEGNNNAAATSDAATDKADAANDVRPVITAVTSDTAKNRQNAAGTTVDKSAGSEVKGVIRVSSSGSSTKSRISKSDYVLKLPITELYVIKREKDAAFQFADATGRYVIYRGELYDMWDNKKKLNSQDKINYSITHLPLAKINAVSGINEIVVDSTKNSMTKGREVFIFLDPADSDSISLLNRLYKSINFAYYHTRIVLVPTSENEEVTGLFACTRATNSEKVSALLTNDYKVIKEAYNSGCVASVYNQNTISFIQLLGIKELPFIISPSGKFISGYIDNPFDFIQNKK